MQHLITFVLLAPLLGSMLCIIWRHDYVYVSQASQHVVDTYRTNSIWLHGLLNVEGETMLTIGIFSARSAFASA